MGRPEEALADFDRALALRPNNAEDISNRASVLAISAGWKRRWRASTARWR